MRTAVPPKQASPVALDGQLQADVLFTAPNPIIALAADKDENVYAVVYETGDILKITPDGKSTTIYSGLKSCSFGAFAAIAVLPNGDLVTYDCVDKTSAVLIKIDQSGNKTTLASFDKDSNLMSMTADPSGKIYLGFWTSGEAMLTVSANPNHLAAAEDITGYVAELGKDGKLNRLYEGGIPMAMTASDKDDLVAVTWGKSGPFESESRKYSVCAATTVFWIVLSEQVEMRRIVAGQADNTPLKQLDAVSAIAAGKNGLLFAAGKGKGEKDRCGIYYMQPGQDPKKLSFTASGVDEDITALAATENNLYFADVNGNVSRVSLTAAK
jgi:hypothetical protein